MQNIHPSLSQLVSKVPRRILIVDDDREAGEMMGLILANFGQDVRTVFVPTQALAVAAEFLPQVAILDLEMPKLSGFELARSLREMPELTALRLIALSGWSTQEIKQRCNEFGFNRFFAKPVSIDQILFALSEV